MSCLKVKVVSVVLSETRLELDVWSYSAIRQLVIIRREEAKRERELVSLVCRKVARKELKRGSL